MASIRMGVTHYKLPGLSHFAHRPWMTWTVLALVCALSPGLCAQQGGRAPSSREANPATSSVLERTVTIPSGDLRRITLPQVRAGTWIVVEANLPAAPASLAAHSLRIEILRDHTPGVSAGDSERSRRRTQHIDSLYLHSGPFDQPLRFLASHDGTYLVVLRQTHPEQESLEVGLRVRLQAKAATSREMQPYELSAGTRTAVAIFSAGLLWTTVLLCGTPIIRAFRSRRRQPEPPWYA